MYSTNKHIYVENYKIILQRNFFQVKNEWGTQAKIKILFQNEKMTSILLKSM